MPPRPRFLTVANFVRKKNAPKTPRSIACTHPEFVLVVRKTFAVTKPISTPCKPRPGTAGRAGRGLEVLKAFFFPPRRRPEESFLGWYYYHGRGRETEQGVPVPQTGKLNRKLRSKLRCWAAPLGRERRIKEGRERRRKAAPGMYSRMEA